MDVCAIESVWGLGLNIAKWLYICVCACLSFVRYRPNFTLSTGASVSIDRQHRSRAPNCTDSITKAHVIHYAMFQMENGNLILQKENAIVTRERPRLVNAIHKALISLLLIWSSEVCGRLRIIETFAKCDFGRWASRLYIGALSCHRNARSHARIYCGVIYYSIAIE